MSTIVQEAATVAYDHVSGQLEAAAQVVRRTQADRACAERRFRRAFNEFNRAAVALAAAYHKDEAAMAELRALGRQWDSFRGFA
jgi:hypothetical protein